MIRMTLWSYTTLTDSAFTRRPHYAVCVGASRDQTTREWSPVIGFTYPPLGVWGGNFGYKRLSSF
jgi:hypothetical protein